MTGISPPLCTSLPSWSSEGCPPPPRPTISKAPADAALLLLSQHTACLVASACSSAHQAVSITKLYSSPSRIHHSRPPRHLLLHQQCSPHRSCSAGCQRCLYFSCCQLCSPSSSTHRHCWHPLWVPWDAPVSCEASCFPCSLLLHAPGQVGRRLSCKGGWSGAEESLKVPWS